MPALSPPLDLVSDVTPAWHHESVPRATRAEGPWTWGRVPRLVCSSSVFTRIFCCQALAICKAIAKDGKPLRCIGMRLDLVLLCDSYRKDIATSKTSFLGRPDLTTFAFLMTLISSPLGLLWWLRGKEPTCKTGDTGDVGSILQLGRSPWRREWQPTPAFSPGESHGQRSLAGYSPRGHKGSSTT